LNAEYAEDAEKGYILGGSAVPARAVFFERRGHGGRRGRLYSGGKLSFCKCDVFLNAEYAVDAEENYILGGSAVPARAV